MYVRQKFSLCLFSKTIFDFVCFPPFLSCFWQKNAFFGSKLRILRGNRQIKNFFTKNFNLSVSNQYTRFCAKTGIFWPKTRQKWWETDKIKKFKENRQSENFCLAYISKLNSDPQKKVMALWSQGSNRGGNATIFPGKSDTTFPWFLIYDLKMKGDAFFFQSKSEYLPQSGQILKWHNVFFF